MMTSFILRLKLPVQIMIEIEKIGSPGRLSIYFHKQTWVQRSEGEKSYKRKKRTGMNSCALVRSCSQVILQTSPIQNAQPQHTSNISKPLKSPSHFSSIFFNHSTFLIKLIHTSLTLDSYWFLKITPFVFSPLLFSKLLDAINFCCDRKIKEVEFIRA